MLINNTQGQDNSFRAFLARLKHLPKGTKIVSLRHTDFNSLTNDEIKTFFAAIPTSVNKLILSSCNLQEDPAKTEYLLKLIPPFVEVVDLSQNGFDSINSGQFDNFLRCLPSTVSAVNLSYNWKNAWNDEYCLPSLHNMPSHITTLYLGAFDERYPVENLVLWLRSIPTSVHTIVFRANRLGARPNEEIVQLLGAMQGVRTLDLGNNLLDSKVDSLRIILLALSATVTHLGLDANALDAKTVHDALSAHPRITHIAWDVDEDSEQANMIPVQGFYKRYVCPKARPNYSFLQNCLFGFSMLAGGACMLTGFLAVGMTLVIIGGAGYGITQLGPICLSFFNTMLGRAPKADSECPSSIWNLHVLNKDPGR